MATKYYLGNGGEILVDAEQAIREAVRMGVEFMKKDPLASVDRVTDIIHDKIMEIMNADMVRSP